jgi:nitrate reductase beta subunit
LLYDAERIEEAAKAPQKDLVRAQRNVILDPSDPQVVTGARRNGISDDVIFSAQKSPVYRFVKEWEIALPLHPEFRTMPMIFYVPPLLPVTASTQNGNYDISSGDLFGSVEQARVPVKYMASLFSAGDEEIIKGTLKKLIAIRIFKRAQTVGDVDQRRVAAALAEIGSTAEEAEQIFRMTSLPRFKDRFVLPSLKREVAIEKLEDPLRHKGQAGLGFKPQPTRGF